MPADRPPLRAVVAGLGTIGIEALRRVVRDPRFTLVGCADPHPDRLGRDAGLLLGPETRLGLTVEGSAERLLGHVGIRESAALVARALGLPPGAPVETELAPVLAASDLATPEGPLARGRVAGIRQVATVAAAGRLRVRLELVIAAGANDPRDE